MKQQEEARILEAARLQEEARQKEAEEKAARKLEEERLKELERQEEERIQKEARERAAHQKELKRKKEEDRLKELERRREEAEVARQEAAAQQTVRETTPQETVAGPAEAEPVSIPKEDRKGKVWYYTGPAAEQQPVIFLNSIAFYFQLSVRNGETEEVFASAAPPEMKLGDFFNHFINLRKRNKKQDIDMADGQQQIYGWKFYTKGFIGTTRELDPAVSLQKNRLKEASIIVAKRIT